MNNIGYLKPLCVAGLYTTLSLITASALADKAQQQQRAEQIEQLIIKYSAHTQARLRKAADPQLTARTAERYVAEATSLQVRYKRSMATASGAHVLYLPYPMAVEQARMYAVQLMQSQPGIEYAEPDYRRYPLSTTPNDPQLNQQWHLMSPADFAGAANVLNAWDLTRGKADIVVAVLDEGITNHIDLQPNLVGGSAVKSGYDMVGDDPGGDGDGRDADPSNPGASVTATQNSTWHGTQVGGIIAARPDNGKFVAGIGWHTRLSAVRILSESGGYLSDQADGMLWAGGESVPGVPNNKQPAHILNLSIGTDGFETCSRTEQHVVNMLKNKGISVVAAAGNENRDVKGSAPANCAGVISVSGVMRDGARAPFANYGELNAIAAPADNIFSTSNRGKRKPGNDGVKSESGTSQSAPQVAGVLALMLAANDQLLDETVIAKADLVDLLTAKLKKSARPFPTIIIGSEDPKGCNDNQQIACVCSIATCGAGLLDAQRAVQSVATAPVAKTGNDRHAQAATSVMLDGSKSTDDAFGGKIVSYQWQQISGTDVTLQNAGEAKATFTTPAATRSNAQLVFKLTVTDDVGLQGSQQVVITVPGKGGGGGLALFSLVGMLGLVGLHRYQLRAGALS